MIEYINAINLLAYAKVDALQKIHDHFEGNWHRAWQSNLSKFLPRDPEQTRTQKSIDPEAEYERLLAGKVDIITIYDNNYPALLKHLANPPFVLYIRGSTSILSSPCFGVVGTRKLSEYGKRATPHIVQDVARAGFTIVSGLAAGIDTVAHQTAVSEHRPTIAVLGCGVDDPTIFPQTNVRLAHQIIADGGAVISEYALGTHGSKLTFPQRNRIISGLSRGILVVEADILSGSLITARCALDQNRDVFAVPGSIFSRGSQGTNSLLKSGAKLVMSSTDILEEYTMEGSTSQKPTIIGDTPQETQVLELLTSEPISIDEIIRHTGLETAQANATVVMMELKNKLKNLGNNTFVSIN